MEFLISINKLEECTFSLHIGMLTRTICSSGTLKGMVRITQGEHKSKPSHLQSGFVWILLLAFCIKKVTPVSQFNMTIFFSNLF